MDCLFFTEIFLVLGLVSDYLSKLGHFEKFHSNLVVRVLGFHCHGLGSIPGSGNWDLLQAAAQPKKKKRKKERNFDIFGVCVCVCVCVCNDGILLSHKKEWNNIMCSATRMDLEMIILSQICCLYVESKKMIQMNLFTKQTHRHRKQRGMGSVYILIYRE